MTKKVSFAEHSGAAWVQHRLVLWDALDVAPDVAEVLAEQLQLRWEDGKLVVSNHWQERVDMITMICDCLSDIFRFKKWTESRWLTVGASSRTMTAGCILGLSDLVSDIGATHGTDLWFLKGYVRLHTEHQNFFSKTAIVSRVAEAFQMQLMRDSRVGLRYEELWECITVELKWILHMPEAVWLSIGKAVGSPGKQLRGECIAAAHVSYHFLWRRVLQPASALPWSLLRGGTIRANLTEMFDGPKPDEPVSAQLWELMNRDFNMMQL